MGRRIIWLVIAAVVVVGGWRTWEYLKVSGLGLVGRLMDPIGELNAEMSEPAWPLLIEGAIAIDRPLNAPEMPGEEYVYWPN